MKTIIVAAATAISLLFGIQASQAAETKIVYAEKALGDTQVRKMWSDIATSAQPLGQYAPWVLVATKDIGDGRILTITQLWAGGICSDTACPLRVYEGDKLLTSDMACSEPEFHSISDDGRMIIACDTLIRTNRQ